MFERCATVAPSDGRRRSADLIISSWAYVDFARETSAIDRARRASSGVPQRPPDNVGGCFSKGVKSDGAWAAGFRMGPTVRAHRCRRPPERAARTGSPSPGTPLRSLEIRNRGNRNCSGQGQRSGRDSNPRYGFPHTAFPVRPLQPLGHRSREARTQRIGRGGTTGRYYSGPTNANKDERRALRQTLAESAIRRSICGGRHDVDE